ncbi:ATP-dependent zinc metalloprotease FtsH [Fusobacterium sp. PH5-44]|uniref:ATP-dependent zinc metalloprotease FtsH n=1 Tax=unclassified Fusobacterium TaxID=2648384 RepID=UPI003D21A15A
MDNNHFNKEDKDKNLEDKPKVNDTEKDENQDLDKDDKEKPQNENKELENEEIDGKESEKKETKSKEENSSKSEEIERKKTSREKQIEILKYKIKAEEEKKSDKKPNNGGFGGINFKNMLVLIGLLVIIFAIFNVRPAAKDSNSNELGYSEFVNKIKNGEIVRVEEKSGELIGYLTHATTIASDNADGTVPEGKNKNIEKSNSKKQGEITYKTRMITLRIGHDPNIMSILTEKNVQLTAIAPDEPSLLMSMISSSLPFLFMIGIWIFMLNRMNKGSGGGPQIFNMGKSKTKDGENISKVTFKDVAGIAESKKELEEVVEFLKQPEKFRKVGAKIPKGVLLLGPPGTGKTLLAKAVAGEAKVPFFSMSGSEFVEMFVGVGASRVRDLFNKARKSAPCIIFIDEIDAVGRKRGTGSGGGNDEREQTLNQMLVEMDGFGNEETIIVLAATNRPDVLDKALLRPGRFDRRVYIDMPDRNGREAILKVHSKGKKIGPDIDFKAIAKQTAGLAGADLANLLNEAAILAARAGRKEITMEDLQEATEKAEMGPAKKSKVIGEKERKITAYHEAGHAVLIYFLPDTSPVYKVTIVPRGFTGGYTMFLPDEKEERTYKLKSEYINDIISTLGGRAAEEIIFGDISTGASGDIQTATGMVHAMVTKLGMTDKFGPLLLDNTQQGDMFQSKLYSDITGKEIDDEIRNIINDCYQKSLAILKNHKTELEALALALLEKDTINREEFEAIMRGEKLPDIE